MSQKVFYFISLVIFLFSSNKVEAQTFADEGIIIDSTLLNFPGKIIIEDLDNDGDKDIITTGNGLVFYIQNAPNQFDKKSLSDMTNGAIDGPVKAFNTLDMNDDRNIGFILVKQNHLILLHNDGNGTFDIVDSSQPLGENSNEIIAVASSLGLGYSIISAEHNPSFLIRWIETGTSGFANTYSNGTATPLGRLKNVDLDNDGHMDIVAQSFGNPNYFYWMRNYNLPAIGMELLHIGPANSILEFGDLDSDGDIDFYDVNLNQWFANNGNGEFDTDNFNTISNETISLGKSTLFDIDLDGDIDIVKASQDEKKAIVLFLNDGFGNFIETQLINSEVQIEEILNADIDNNGTPDLVIATVDELSEKRKLIWYPNIFEFESISGCNYFDENDNGQRDSDEKTLKNLSTKLDNLSIQLNSNGCHSYFVRDGIYQLSYQPSDIWRLSSDSSSYTVTVNENSYTDLDFGFVPRDTLIAGIMHAVSGITRCNTDVKFNFIFQNQGTTIISEGIIWVYQDSLTELANTLHPIDTMLDDRTFGFKFENLYPGETITRTLELSVPGLGGDIEPGTLIEISSATEAMNSLGWVNFFKHNFSEEIRCAYDPNDKLISPMREEEENYTLFGDTLVYTVRFQNTGNDTAFNVVIRDTLDQNLEVGTFNIIHSSHRAELTTDIQGGRNVTFNFENILLPDSTIDFIGSQGYVTYAIEAKDPIPENTEILNTASIYFDFNPPIVTNTTLNTLVSCYPIEEQFISVSINEGEVYNLPDGTAVSQTGTYEVAIEDQEGCPIEYYIISLEVLTSTNDLKLQSTISIAPNPCQDDFILTLDIDGEIDLLGTISDPFDKKITTASIISGNTKFDTHQLTSGVYFLQIHTKGGELIAVKKFVVTN